MHLLQVRQPFSVRIMIPCYKEDIETLEETLECAIEAAKVAIDKGMANAGKPHSRSRLEVQQWLWQPDLLQGAKSILHAGRLMGGCCMPASLFATRCEAASVQHTACQHTLTVLPAAPSVGLSSPVMHVCLCNGSLSHHRDTQQPQDIQHADPQQGLPCHSRLAASISRSYCLQPMCTSAMTPPRATQRHTTGRPLARPPCISR